MAKQLHILVKFVAIAFFSLLLNNWNAVSAALPQEVSAKGRISVDYLQVTELPVNITLPTLEKTEQGYVLNFSAANGSGDQILGITFLILVLDSENKVRSAGSWTAGIQLASYATQDLSIRVPIKLSIRNRYRVVLAPEQLFGRESIWQVLNARKSVEAYARGEDYVMPSVQRVANQFDPPSAALRIIY